MKTVSVVIPMYNGAATVGEAVESVCADLGDGQGWGGGVGDWEVIVVDDGSTDGGAGVVEEAGRAEGRVRLVRQERGGTSAAKNRGLDEAQGEYVRFLDADDRVTPGSTRWMIEVAERSGLGAARGAYGVMNARGVSLGRESASPAPGRVLGMDDLLDANRLGTSAHVVQRRLIGGERFDQAMRVCEDWEMWLRLAERGVRWAPCVGDVVSLYRVNPGGLSRDYGAMLAGARRVIEGGFARSRRRGDEGRNLSGKRERRALAGQALAFAMQAVAGGGSAMINDAMRMMASAGGPEGGAEIEGVQAAHAAAWGVMLGLGIGPEEAGARRRAWCGAVGMFWERLEQKGWMSGEQVEAAWEELARQVVGPARVAAEIVRRVRAMGVRKASVVGLGMNGRVAAAELLRAGVAVSVRDDRWGDGAAPEEERVITPLADRRIVEAEPIASPVGDDAAVVIAPSEDGALAAAMSRVAEERRTVRWRRVP